MMSAQAVDQIGKNIPLNPARVSTKTPEHSQDFMKAMQQVTKNNNLAGTNAIVTKIPTTNVQTQKQSYKTTVQNDRQSGGNRNTKDVSQTTKADSSSEVKDEDVTATADMKDQIKDAAKSVIKEMAEEMELSEEDILAIMDILNMPITDILDQTQMTNLFVELAGTDMMSLVTDENLYASLQELTQVCEETVNNLLENLGINEEDLKAFCLEITAENEQIADFGQMMIPQENEETVQTEEQVPVIKVEKEKTDQKDNTVKEEKENTEVDTEESLSQKTMKKVDNSPKEESTTQDEHHEMTNQNEPKDIATDVENTTFKQEAPQPLPEPKEIMRQIMDYMNVKVKEDVTEMEMQLHPSSLGTVNLSIAQKAGNITAQFTVQNETVKEAMESQMVELKENLENQGIKVEAVEVTVASHEFERNLSDQNKGQEDAKTEDDKQTKAIRRKIINLNDYEDLQGIPVSDGDDATRIAMEMMSTNGNSLDMLA